MKLISGSTIKITLKVTFGFTIIYFTNEIQSKTFYDNKLAAGVYVYLILKSPNFRIKYMYNGVFLKSGFFHPFLLLVTKDFSTLSRFG